MLELTALLYVFSLQRVQEGAPVGEYVPGAQGLQSLTEDEPVVSRNFPAEQLKHTFVVEPYLPAGHLSHSALPCSSQLVS